MAKQKNKFTSDMFVDIYEKNIEQSTKRNIFKLFSKEKQLEKTHKLIVEVLQKEEQLDNKYLDFNIFKQFATEYYEEAKEKKRLKELEKIEEEKKQKKLEEKK